MKLSEYIKQNHGTNTAFALAHGMSKQQVGQMVNKGIYYVYDGMLMIAKKEVIQNNGASESLKASKIDRVGSVLEWEINTCNNRDWDSVAESVIYALEAN